MQAMISYLIWSIISYLQLKYNFEHTVLLSIIYTLKFYSRNYIVKNVTELYFTKFLYILRSLFTNRYSVELQLCIFTIYDFLLEHWFFSYTLISTSIIVFVRPLLGLVMCLFISLVFLGFPSTPQFLDSILYWLSNQQY